MKFFRNRPTLMEYICGTEAPNQKELLEAKRSLSALQAELHEARRQATESQTQFYQASTELDVARLEAKIKTAHLDALKKCARAPEVTDVELISQFALAPESKLFKAIHQFIEQEIQNEITSAAILALPSERKLEHTNRAAGMIALQTNLLSAVTTAAAKSRG